eukprot:m.142279 g.142279  ORF g.142279 m.142279 type:complete len:184 (-) comp10035_c0_seq11:22-573(-)
MSKRQGKGKTGGKRVGCDAAQRLRESVVEFAAVASGAFSSSTMLRQTLTRALAVFLTVALISAAGQGRAEQRRPSHGQPPHCPKSPGDSRSDDPVSVDITCAILRTIDVAELGDHQAGFGLLEKLRVKVERCEGREQAQAALVVARQCCFLEALEDATDDIHGVRHAAATMRWPSSRCQRAAV